MIKKDIQKLQELINKLELVVEEEKDKKNNEEEKIENDIETNIIESNIASN